MRVAYDRANYQREPMEHDDFLPATGLRRPLLRIIRPRCLGSAERSCVMAGRSPDHRRGDWHRGPRFCRPIRGTAKSRRRTQLSAIFDWRRGVSLSFPACWELHWLCLAHGTRDAKELGFDHVRPSEPYCEQCLDKQEFISSPDFHHLAKL